VKGDEVALGETVDRRAEWTWYFDDTREADPNRGCSDSSYNLPYTDLQLVAAGGKPSAVAASFAEDAIWSSDPGLKLERRDLRLSIDDVIGPGSSDDKYSVAQGLRLKLSARIAAEPHSPLGSRRVTVELPRLSLAFAGFGHPCFNGASRTAENFRAPAVFSLTVKVRESPPTFFERAGRGTLTVLAGIGVAAFLLAILAVSIVMGGRDDYA
jgi:hypothetical protein